MPRSFDFLYCPDSTSRSLCDTVLLESRNFVVTPTVGSIVPGWLLIITKMPHLSMSVLSECQLAELDEVRSQTEAVLSEAFGSPAATFEHGPLLKGQKIGCGVDHAHLHVVALSSSLIGASEKLGYQNLAWQSVGSFRECLVANDSPYLAIEDIDGQCYRTDATNAPSQYFRRAIADMAGVPNEYDWRRFPFAENVSLTIARSKPVFLQGGTMTLHHEHRIK